MEIKNPSIDPEKIKLIIQRHLSQWIKDIKQKLPEVLTREPAYWATITEPEYLMIVFLTPQDQKRIKESMSKGQNPFLGLITTSGGPAAFRLEKAKSMTIDNCRVNNSFTFSLGQDSTAILINHQQSIETKEIGQVSYIVSLAYILSYGDEINNANVYDHLDGLLAFSETIWRKVNART